MNYFEDDTATLHSNLKNRQQHGTSIAGRRGRINNPRSPTSTALIRRSAVKATEVKATALEIEAVEISNECGTEIKSPTESLNQHQRQQQNQQQQQKKQQQHQQQDLISLEHERQLMILVLLAQLTALNDWTPNTFYAHLNDLLNKGLLDYELIMKSAPSPAASIFEQMGIRGSFAVDNYIHSRYLHHHSAAAADSDITNGNSDALVPYSNHHHQNPSMNVKDYPLIMSRYEREFIERKLLASGSFGQVFQVTNKLDHCDYAMKRVMFSTKISTMMKNQHKNRHDSSAEQINSVIREIQCLAQLNHDNVVRYYTSWLEPVWTMRNGNKNGYMNTNGQYLINDQGTDDPVVRQCEQSQQQQQPLIQVASAEANGDSHHRRDWSDLPSYNPDCSISSEGSNDSEWSIWTIEGKSDEEVSERCNNESKNQSSINSDGTQSISLGNYCQSVADKASPNNVTYQICMNIQMELCETTTLADWIQHRNNTIIETDPIAEFNHFKIACDIFHQIVKGLNHIHSKAIVHRDLKPANILRTSDGKFKICDFGLSRKLRTLNGGMDFDNTTIPSNNSIVPFHSSSSDDTDCNLKDSMTSGVGTASYASPEQLETQCYGREADIFSLGMILLELFCTFGSAHERAATFHDCRNGRLPKVLTGKNSFLKDIGKLVLACTEKDKRKRPTASKLASLDSVNESKMTEYRDQLRDTEIKKLKENLKEAKILIERQRDELRGKDDVIQQLNEELRALKEC